MNDARNLLLATQCAACLAFPPRQGVDTELEWSWFLSVYKPQGQKQEHSEPCSPSHDKRIAYELM